MFDECAKHSCDLGWDQDQLLDQASLNEIKVSLIEITPQCVLTDGECE
jgi:hypothetical protein